MLMTKVLVTVLQFYFYPNLESYFSFSDRYPGILHCLHDYIIDITRKKGLIDRILCSRVSSIYTWVGIAFGAAHQISHSLPSGHKAGLSLPFPSGAGPVDNGQHHFYSGAFDWQGKSFPGAFLPLSWRPSPSAYLNDHYEQHPSACC